MTEPRDEQSTDDTITDDEGAALLASQPDDSAADTDDASGTETGPEGNGEAARYRRRLRDVEAERDGLKGRVEAMQRAEAERLAGSVLRDASDLWAGTELSALLDDSGDVDPKVVTERAEKLVKDKPHFRRSEPMPVKRGQQLRGGGDPEDERPKLDWSAVLRGSRQ